MGRSVGKEFHFKTAETRKLRNESNESRDYRGLLINEGSTILDQTSSRASSSANFGSNCLPCHQGIRKGPMAQVNSLSSPICPNVHARNDTKTLRYLRQSGDKVQSFPYCIWDLHHTIPRTITFCVCPRSAKTKQGQVSLPFPEKGWVGIKTVTSLLSIISEESVTPRQS